MSFGKRGRASQREPVNIAQPRKVWGNKGNQSPLSYADVNPQLVLAALHVCAANDAGLLFGCAQGGRGATLILYLGGAKETEYAKSVSELEDLLRQLITDLGSGAEDLSTLFKLDA